MASTEQTQAMTCYRHPGTETAVSCSSCGRPICTDCMVFASVGIKCPECAGQPAGVKKATTRVRRSAGESMGGIVTKSLIAVNLAVFLMQISQGDIWGRDSTVYERGALFGPLVADGEWWRLITSGFLHYGVLHLLFNMLMLWWFGTPLEMLLGRGRFLAVYMISIVGGAAGALLFSPLIPSAGASAAVYGILGAGLVLERRGINVFGGSALLVILFNLTLTFIYRDSISVGGHIGGLVAGALAILVLSRFGRAHAAYARFTATTALGLAAIVVGSIAIAYFRVRGYA